MDVVGGFLLADGTSAKALTGIDDHSRFCVSARLMPRERTRAVCDGLAAALRRLWVPEQILTDNGKVFTGRFDHPPVEVLFDRICRENGIEHLLTAPRSPTTTGKIERFHRTLRAEFRTGRVFATLRTAQAALDEWVARLQHPTPAPGARRWPPRRNGSGPAAPRHRSPRDRSSGRAAPDRRGEAWVTPHVSAIGVVCVSWQQVCVGVAARRRPRRRLVTDKRAAVLRGDELINTVHAPAEGRSAERNASVQTAPAR